MSQYLNVGQEDLQISATWAEDLTGYTAKLWYYREEDGPDSKVGKTAVLIAGASSSQTYYDFIDGDDPFMEEGYYVFFFEIEKDSRPRCSRPIRRYVHAKGTGWN